MDWVGIATGIAGGIGLFLLGMRLMTEGLRIAAGRALRRILARWTATRMRALLSGILITSLVQSSSAVTVAVIGFANAGLLTLGQSVAVIYGSNVGTTVTGWLVALVGIHVNVKATALPAIGLGMALRLAPNNQRLGALGEALAGFGLFFLGIDVLKTAMSGMQDQLPMDSLVVAGPLGVLLLTFAGFFLTLMMQSSSAAIAIILTSVASEVIPIEAGACLVIGANVGTTTTAAIAVVGATSNAKRVAMAHVAFNVLTGVVALLTLPLLLFGVARFREVLGLGAQPAAVVAAFHTLFNLLGVLLMWPLTKPLVDFLRRRFQTPEEEEGRARYLDRNVLATPVLAIGALGLELARMGVIARQMSQQSLRREAGSVALGHRREALERLVAATGDFVTELQRQRLSQDIGPALAIALRVARYYAEAAELAQTVAAAGETLEALPPDSEAEVRAFESEVVLLLERTAVDLEGTDPIVAGEALADLEHRYAALKNALLEEGARGRIPISGLVAQLDRLSNIRRLAEQMERGARYLWSLGENVKGDGSGGDAESVATGQGRDRLADPAMDLAKRIR